MKPVSSLNAPKAIGPYSQAIESGNLIFVSGQLPINAKTGDMAEGIAEQTAQSLQNIKAILEEAGSGMDHVLKTTVLLKNMGDFGTMNDVYGSFFKGQYPARCCYEVSALPKQALVEIEAIAEKGADKE